MRTHCALGWALLLATVGMGCGGGGSAPVAQGGDVVVGSMRLTGQVNQPQTFTGDATVYAVTGNITRATLADATPTVDETEIVFQKIGPTAVEVDACSPDGSNVRKICDFAQSVGNIQVNPDGTYVYFNTANGSVFRAPYAGGTPVLLESGVNDYDICPSGTKVIYNKIVDDGWWTASATFSGDELISTDTSLNLGGAISDSSAVLYDTASDTIFQLALQTGSTPALAKTVGAELVRVRASDKPQEFAYLRQNGANDELHIVTTGFANDNGGGWTDKQAGTKATTTFEFFQCLSPDRSHALFANTSTAELTTYFVNLAGATVIRQEVGDIACTWGPMISSRQFVGTSLWPSSAAVLIAEAGSSVPTVILADATTKASMAVEKVSQNGDSNVVLKLTCDQLTKLHYTVGNNYNLRAVVNSGSGLKGAFVSFDASTGKVSTILTFKKPVRTKRSGGALTLEGDGIVDVINVNPKLERTLRTNRS